MKIAMYQSDGLASELVPLLREKYGRFKNFEYFIADVEKAFDYCHDNQHVTFRPMTVYEKGKMIAHVALIRDSRLPAGEAFFGFLEVPENREVFTSLWSRMLAEARNDKISTLKGPVNGSIWHQYRCISETNGSEYFKTEMLSEPFYFDLLRSVAPVRQVDYYSGYREQFDIVFRVTEASYAELGARGFSIEEKRNVTVAEMLAIAEISKKVFCSSWGYTELSDQEFIKLYPTDRLAAHLTALYLLYKGPDIVGFCSTLREDEYTLTYKTICVLPEYRGLGLGNALAYKVHFDAQAAGIKRILYVLIRDGNNIKNFPQDGVTIFRRYASFEFDV